MNNLNLTDLPNEVIELMVLNLDYKSIANFCNTRREVNFFCQDETFWIRKIQHDYGHNYYFNEKLSARDNYLNFNAVYDSNIYKMMKNILTLTNIDQEYVNGTKEWMLTKYEFDVKSLVQSNNTKRLEEILQSKNADFFVIIIFWANRLNNRDIIDEIIDDLSSYREYRNLDDIMFKTINLIVQSGEHETSLLPVITEIGEDILIDDLLINAARYNNSSWIRATLPLTSPNLIDRMIQSEVEPAIYLRLKEYNDRFIDEVLEYLSESEIEETPYTDELRDVLNKYNN